MHAPPPVPAARSGFVTALAWIFIVLAGLMTAMSLLQNLMLQLVMQPLLQQQLEAPTSSPGLPPVFAMMLTYMPWFVRGFLLLAVAHLSAAIGLLRRRNWGRLLFIAMLGLDIAYQLGGAGLQWWLSDSMEGLFQLPVPTHGPAPNAQAIQDTQMMEGMVWVMRLFALIFALALSVLFGWIIRRLCSEAVRREFAASTPHA